MVHGRGVADQAGSLPWDSERSQAPQSSSAVDSADSLSRLRRGRREKLSLPKSSQGCRTQTLEPAEHSCSESPKRGARCSAGSRAAGLQTSRKKLPKSAAAHGCEQQRAAGPRSRCVCSSCFGSPGCLCTSAQPQSMISTECSASRMAPRRDPSLLPACRVSHPARSCDHSTSGSEKQKRHRSWRPNTGAVPEGGPCLVVRQSHRSLQKVRREPTHLPA